MADGQPRILFEPGHVRVGVRGVSGIKVGGGKGPPTGGSGPPGVGPGGRGRGRGSGNSLGHLVSAFGAIAAATAQGVPSPPDVSALTLLSTVTLAAPGTLGVAGISQAFNDLIVAYSVRGTSAVVNDELHLNLNSDATAANYDFSNVFNASTTPTSQTSAAGHQIAEAIPDSSATASRFGTGTIELIGYTSTSWHKNATCAWGSPHTDAGIRTGVNTVTWKNTAAVTAVLLFGLNATNLATGSTMRVYGRL